MNLFAQNKYYYNLKLILTIIKYTINERVGPVYF
jgi:hypothetical protein